LLQLEVAGTAFLRETRAVEAEPITIVDWSLELLHPFCLGDRSFAGTQLAEAGKRLSTDGVHPMPGGQRRISRECDAAPARSNIGSALSNRRS
jgi:hypothetical protein